MNIFYKPPLQAKLECDGLEDNYINCIVQKAIRDNVLVNRCNLDSVLWFHLECPLRLQEFDNPNEYKKKFRDFFSL